MQKLIDFIIRFKEYITLIALSIMCLSLISMGDISRIGGFRTFLVGTFGWVRETFSFIPNPQSLKNENKSLRELNLMLSNEVTKMHRAIAENENLKDLLEIKAQKEYDYIPASIVGRTTIEMRNYFTLNKGKSSGVQNGMIVRTATNIAGIVAGATQNYCLVESIKNREIKIPSIISRNAVDGLLVWEGGDDFYLKNISKTFDVKIGDDVVTSDFSSRFPKDLPIGKISNINEEQGDLFLKVKVTPYSDIAQVGQVFIIKYIPDPQREKLIEEIDELLKIRKNSRNIRK